MGIKLAVKKSVAPACGSFGSIAAAIASPYMVQNTFGDTSDAQCDAGEYVAVQYNDDGGSAGFFVNFAMENLSNNAAAMNIYTVNDVGTVIGTVNHADGVINPGDESLEIPYDSIPFYVVIQNAGGSSCDIFEFTLFAAT